METTRPALAVLVDEYHDDDDGDQGEEGADSETHSLGVYLEEMKARRGRGDRLFGRHVRAAVDRGHVSWAELVQLLLAGFVRLAVAPAHAGAEEDVERRVGERKVYNHKTKGEGWWRSA